MTDAVKEFKLTNKQQAFVNEYLRDFNATRAAKVAGYSERTAYSIGSENLKKPEMQGEISRRLSERRMSADEVLDRLTDIARGDMGAFFNGYVMLEMDEAKASGKSKLIKKLKQRTITKIGKGEGDEDTEIHDLEIELYSAHDALRDLGKVHGLFVDRTRTEDWRTDLIVLLRKGETTPEAVLQSLDHETANALFREAGVTVRKEVEI